MLVFTVESQQGLTLWWQTCGSQGLNLESCRGQAGNWNKRRWQALGHTNMSSECQEPQEPHTPLEGQLLLISSQWLLWILSGIPADKIRSIRWELCLISYCIFNEGNLAHSRYSMSISWMRLSFWELYSVFYTHCTGRYCPWSSKKVQYIRLL